MANERGTSDTARREEAVLAFWKEEQIFEKTLEKDAPKGEFVFYDGPPFATGLPHQGSLLSSVSKDVLPRYKTMRGYRVRRRWGWDTHGLPIESLVEKKLGLKSKKDIIALGVETFNETARAMVLEYVADWKRYVDRVGRFVDFDNAYKTMDTTFIESVWWSLKEIHKKGRLYEGRKVLMYCPHCETPLAKAEIAMDNTYKDITEEAATVKFKVVDPASRGLPEHTYLLAWTTTPWTLPGNVGLAVGPDIEYILLKKQGGAFSRIPEGGEIPPPPEPEYYLVAKEIFEARAKPLGERWFDFFSKTVSKEGMCVKGSDLVGLSYEPLYMIEKAAAHTGKKWEVLAADFVTTTDGTGIVHTAVIYGEDDYQLGLKEGLPMVPLLNPNATYNDDAPVLLRGQYIKKGEPLIKDDLRERGLLFAADPHTHSYPHCYRCGTPLIYNAVSSWFIDIQAVKARMIAENEKITWSPAHLKHGRFTRNLETAPDWTISRNRFWASPLPIWKDQKGDVTVIGSLEELKERTKKSGNRYFVMRHGEAAHNLSDVLDATPDHSALTDVGRTQTIAAAAAHKGTGITRIYASPFLRTRQTAELMAEELGLSKEGIVYDDRLREFDFGSLNGKKLADFVSFRNTHPYDERIPGGESYQDAKNRFGEFLYELEGALADETILIVTHGAGFEALAAVVEGADKERSKDLIDASYPQRGEVREFPFIPLPHKSDYELDFHLPYIDRITLLADDGTPMTRIPEVVDCWVESGSMPFAEYHYPFENRTEFEKRAPGDFVTEYIGQTRAWFYYMHAISVSLFDRAPFKNVVTTGTILGGDGAKLSKSKGNFTDPYVLFDQFGADAFRYHLMSSVVMQAEDLVFRDDDVKEVQNRVVNMLRNIYAFYALYEADLDPHSAGKTSTHPLDRWILLRLAQVTEAVTEAFERYDTIRASRPMREFIEDFSTWYVRRSRDRVKSTDEADRQAALHTMRHVLKEFSKVIAPVMPFVADEIYRGVKGEGDPMSVHLADWPETARGSLLGKLFGGKGDETLIADMERVRALSSLALMVRQKANVKVRQPLASLTLPGAALPDELLALIREELNVKEVVMDAGLKEDEVHLDTVLTPELINEGDVREFARAVADARKSLDLQNRDRVTITVDTSGEATLTGATIPGTDAITFVGLDDAPFKAELSTGTVRFSVSHAS